MHHRCAYAVRTATQDVGLHRARGGPVHQQHGFLLQYVTSVLGTTVRRWDMQLQGVHIRSPHLTYPTVTSSTNIVIDLWILILPIKVLLTIRRPGREKIALIGIFTLGIFSCIASIVRLYSVRVYTEVSKCLISPTTNTWLRASNVSSHTY
jgi:hypothetical protein